MNVLLTLVFFVLLVNFIIALSVVLWRRGGASWLLVLLLSSTTGAGLSAVFGLLIPEADARRAIDVALIFAALAPISAVAAVAAKRGHTSSGEEAHGGATDAG